MDRFGRRRYGWLGFLVVMACAAGIAGVLAYGWLFSQQRIDRSQTALVALCALRHDLDQRIDASQEFLRLHPEGIPGLTAAFIRQSLQNSQRTRATLDVLDCKE